MGSVHELPGQNCSTVNGFVDSIDKYGRLIGLIFGEGMNNKILAIIGSFSSGIGSAVVKYGKTVSITLMLIPVAIEVVRSISKWNKGEISGKRAAKNIIDTLLSNAAGVGAGLAGFTIGTVIGGPVLGFVFGVACGAAGRSLADVLIDKLTKEIFDLPKTQALENAYQYLGVHHRPSDSEVDKAYKKRSLIDHPDKGGSQALSFSHFCPN